MQEPRIIKKYPNRRLYDTVISRYITLEDIKELVLTHVAFKVIDVRTQEEVTNTLLLQIINEEESEHVPIFTTAVLENMIRFYGNPMQKQVSQFLERSFSLFNEKQMDFEHYLKPLMDQDHFFSAMAEFTKQNMDAWRSISDQYSAKTKRQKPESNPLKYKRKKPTKK